MNSENLRGNFVKRCVLWRRGGGEEGGGLVEHMEAGRMIAFSYFCRSADPGRVCIGIRG